MCNLSLFLRRATGNVIDSFITFCCWCIVQFVLAGALNAPKLNKRNMMATEVCVRNQCFSSLWVLAEALKSCSSLLFGTIVQTPDLSVQHGGIFSVAELPSEILWFFFDNKILWLKCLKNTRFYCFHNYDLSISYPLFYFLLKELVENKLYMCWTEILSFFGSFSLCPEPQTKVRTVFIFIYTCKLVRLHSCIWIDWMPTKSVEHFCPLMNGKANLF